MTAQNNMVGFILREKMIPKDNDVVVTASELQISCSEALIYAARTWNLATVECHKEFRKDRAITKGNLEPWLEARRNFLNAVRSEYELEPLSKKTEEIVDSSGPDAKELAGQ